MALMPPPSIWRPTPTSAPLAAVRPFPTTRATTNGNQPTQEQLALELGLSVPEVTHAPKRLKEGGDFVLKGGKVPSSKRVRLLEPPKASS